MASLKDIKSRIGGVKKTRQITSAMKLVAGAKLKKATDRAVEARPYQERLTDVLGRVAAQAGEQFEDPLLERRDEVSSIFVAFLTTDRGLCGPFNNNMLRQAVDWMYDKQEQGIDLHLHIYGRKGVEFLAHRGFEGETTINYDKTPKMELVRPLANQMTRGFAKGEFDQAWVVYNTFVNTMTQTPNFRQVVPLVIPDQQGEASLIEHKYEPSAEGLLGELLPLYLRTLLLQAFLETEAGEHAARMTAMDNATRNATELIDDLTLEYNRARQAAITTEIIEIVSGAEALK